MQVELKVNDKSVQAEIPEEQLKETVLFEQLKRLGLIEEQRTGYERVEKGDVYYLNIINGETVAETECNGRIDEGRYDTGNYYSNKTIAENNARADRLLRCLRQWQAANDRAISVSDWKNDNIFKYHIEYDCFNDFLFVDLYYSFSIPKYYILYIGGKSRGSYRSIQR